MIISRFLTALKSAGFLMHMPRHAILAVLIPLAMSAKGMAPPNAEKTPPPPQRQTTEEPPPAERTELDHPLPVRCRLADGGGITGELTAWDRDGIDGSFGRREWIELHHEDIRRIYRRVMDERSAADWVNLGRALLLAALDQPQARRWAERCFQRALSLDGEAEAAIAAAREEAARLEQRRAEAEATARAERLATASPEARDWPATPWPELTAEEQRTALDETQSEARDILERAGLPLTPVETDHFLLFADMAQEEALQWAARLDETYALLAGRFDLPARENVFWGKAVVFVVPDRDRFRLMEAESFNQFVDDATHGLCHPLGPKVFINCHRPTEDDLFGDAIVREVVHGFMHRYRTPHRLSTWANEGLADYFASVLFRNTRLDSERRRAAVGFIRRGGDIDGVLDMSYGEKAPGPRDRLGYAVGALVIEVMIREQPDRFARWVNAVKDGKDWEKALTEDFGVPRAALVETVKRYYTMND